MPTLDIFNQDAFSVTNLTQAINKIPFVPGRAGMLIPWDEQGVNTTSIMIEEVEGVLSIIDPSPRGGPGTTVAKEKRTVRSLVIPHYEVNDAIYADEVQGVRAFGTETELDTVQALVNRRLEQHVAWRLDPTLEYQRVGAVKGIILNGSGSTLYNLFDEFDVSQPTEVDFDLDNNSPASGALRKKCAQVSRTIADALGGLSYVGLHAFCGDDFFDDLLSHPEVVESYKGTPMAQVLREGYVYPNGMKVYGAFEFGGIVWENYRGKIGNSPIIDTNKCHIFPIGVPGLFVTRFAPADYVETVNTIGLPRYSRQYMMPNGKGVYIDVQMNAINYCSRPNCLVQGKRT